MAKIIIYDVVKRHLPQDYVGPEPVSIFSTFRNLMDWMEQHDCLKASALDKFEKQKPIIIAQLDSSMFNDMGNDLMKSCYDRWVSGLNFDHLIQSCDVPLDMGQTNFNNFEAKYKQLNGDPMYCNAEPNIGDTYKETFVIEKPNLQLDESIDFFDMITCGHKTLSESHCNTKEKMKLFNEANSIDDLLGFF